MIRSKNELKEYLEADACNYESQNNGVLYRIKNNLLSNPITEQKYIWSYLKRLRYIEYYEYKRKSNFLFTLFYIWSLYKLRKLSHITGFQIPPHVCGKGLTIWHWGPIIINAATKNGDNCTLYPGVLIGHKKPGLGAAIIGSNVFIGAGTKIIGAVTIGDNVTIGQNCVITKDIPDNAVIVSSSINRNLKNNKIGIPYDK